MISHSEQEIVILCPGRIIDKIVHFNLVKNPHAKYLGGWRIVGQGGQRAETLTVRLDYHNNYLF